MYSSKIRTIYKNSGPRVDTDGYKMVGLPCELREIERLEIKILQNWHKTFLQEESCSICHNKHYTKFKIFRNSYFMKPIIVCNNCHSNTMNIPYNSQYKDNCYCEYLYDNTDLCKYCDSTIYHELPIFQFWDSCHNCNDPVHHNTCNCKFFHKIFVKELESSTGDEFNRLYEAIKSDKKGHHRKRKNTLHLKDALHINDIRTISNIDICYSSTQQFDWYTIVTQQYVSPRHNLFSFKTGRYSAVSCLFDSECNDQYFATNYRKLFVKCDECSNNAIFYSNKDELLCYDCNHKIDVYLTKEKQQKIKVISKQRYAKKETKKEKKTKYNNPKRIRRKTSMKKLYDLHCLDNYPINFSQMTRNRIIIQPKDNKREQIANRLSNKQQVPPYWNSEINKHMGWVNTVTRERNCMYAYESMYPELPMCSICFKGTSNKTDCGHVMHKECINKWLSSYPTCPVCRTKLI